MKNKRTGSLLSMTSILTLFTVMFIAAFSVYPANAQVPQGRISGFVYEAPGDAELSHIDIQVYDSSWKHIVTVTTDELGLYYVSLPVGNYYIHTSNSRGLIDKYYYSGGTAYYYNRQYASLIPVTEDTETFLPTIVLSSGAASISGRITEDSSGAGLEFVTVIAYAGTPNSSSSISATTETDADGYYTIHGLARQVLVFGTYYNTQTIYVGTDNNAGYVDEYYDNTTDYSKATQVVISSGVDTSGIDFGLQAGGTISGRVTRAADGVGIPGSTIMFQREVVSFTAPSITTDEQGYFSMSGLKPGKYWVSANAGGYVGRVYDQTSFNGATMITVESGATVSDIDFELELGGSITGRITRASDGSVSNALFLLVLNVGGSYLGSDTLDSNGYYSVTGLPAGDYYISVSPYSFLPSASGLAMEYYQNALTRGRSRLVHLEQYQNVFGIDVELEEDSTISGTITKEVDGSPINNITVRAYDSDWNSIASDATDSSGNYTITGLRAGEYFIGTYNANGFIDEFYDNIKTRSGASAITVEYNQAITDMDLTLSPGGAISGTVLKSSELTGIPSVPIQVYDGNWIPIKSKSTDNSGNYSIDGLAPGDYFVRADSSVEYIGEYYGDAVSSNDATAVTVIQDQVTGGIDFELEASFGINGTVTSFILNTPLEGIQVYAYDSNWDPVGSSTTDDTGRYRIENLQPDSKYYVETRNDQDYQDVYCCYSKTPDSAGLVYLQYASQSISFTLLKEPTVDFDRDEKADILWRDRSNGDVHFWYMDGAAHLDTEYVYTVTDLNWKIVAEADFNRDGKIDFLWRNLSTGQNSVWFMNGATRIGTATLQSVSDTDWSVAGTADFNDDGMPDIVWRNVTTGKNIVWYMNGAARTGNAPLPDTTDPLWNFVGIADFNDDGSADMILRNSSTGKNAVWFLNGTTYSGSASLPSVPDLNWQIARIIDYNGDGNPDLLWHNTSTGKNCIYFMDGLTKTSAVNIENPANPYLRIFDIGNDTVETVESDFNSDGHADILWRNQSTGQNSVWFMNGSAQTGSSTLSPVTDTNWKIVGTADFNSDGKTDIVWRNQSTGRNAVWLMNNTTYSSGASLPSVNDANWTIVGAADFNGDGYADILWRNQSTGKNALWFMNGAALSGSGSLSSVADATWTIAGTSDLNGDGNTDILWRNTSSGGNAAWYMNGTTRTSSVSLPSLTDLNWTIVP